MNANVSTKRKPLGPTEIVTRLAKIEGWRLSGDGDAAAIEKTFSFKNFYETLAFVNAVAFIAHGMDHHPDLSVHYSRCVVRYNTHDARGITELDFDAARRIEALAA